MKEIQIFTNKNGVIGDIANLKKLSTMINKKSGMTGVTNN